MVDVQIYISFFSPFNIEYYRVLLLLKLQKFCLWHVLPKDATSNKEGFRCILLFADDGCKKFLPCNYPNAKSTGEQWHRFHIYRPSESLCHFGFLSDYAGQLLQIAMQHYPNVLIINNLEYYNVLIYELYNIVMINEILGIGIIMHHIVCPSFLL